MPPSDDVRCVNCGHGTPTTRRHLEIIAEALTTPADDDETGSRCPGCGGTGVLLSRWSTVDHPCPDCRGYGEVPGTAA